jgi:tRNA1Val (adenine37-N6)-methyltransferase
VFSDFNDFAKQSGKKFDLIVSNPPYYPNHLVSQNNKRNLALHHESLDFNELAEGVTSLLDKEGKLWLILPPDQLKIFDSIALKNQLFCQHITAIFDKPDSKNIRSIAAYSFYPTKQIEQQVFYIKDNQSEYSEMYQALLKDFLLKL